MTYTIMIQNHALQNGRWKGTYSSIEDARAVAKVLAERSQPFMEYTICEGSQVSPGPDVKGEPTYRAMEPTWLSAKRAKEIWENRSSGGDFHGVVSSEEDAEVKRIWLTMKGSTSWMDALLSISQGRHPRKAKP